MEPIVNMGLQILLTVHVFVWFTSQQLAPEQAVAAGAVAAAAVAMAAAMAVAAVVVAAAAAVALASTDLVRCRPRYLNF